MLSSCTTNAEPIPGLTKKNEGLLLPDTIPENGDVSITKTEHVLYYIEDLADIETGKPQWNETVPALQLENNMGVKVKAMAKGGNLVELSIGDTNYIWENKEGAVYYGAESDAFPLKRGLILHGGVRMAAVTAEHGLYYDVDWDMRWTGSKDGKEKSIVLQIQDTQANRDRVGSPEEYSQGPFNRDDKNDGHLTKYPVTDMIFTYTITLRTDEDFVRLNMKVDNPTDEVKHAEAWLPMTFPITEDTQIVSEQVTRWRRDEWCFPDLANVVDWNSSEMEDFKKPLDWPTGGIFYDFPYMQGNYHGVTTDPVAGKGIVYVTPEGGSPHYTKMWSWGNKDNFDREEELKKNFALGAGRPYTEYYEPWNSGFNFAFFQTTQFEPMTSYSWEVALLPITSGMTSDDNEVLKSVVKGEILKRPGLQSLSETTVEPYVVSSLR